MSPPEAKGRRTSVIGPYLLQDTIGTGASSEVRLAFHSGTRQHHACKIIQKDAVRERNQKSQIYEEIKGMNLVLNHPNVVALYGVYNTPRRIYIVMELIKGRELLDEIITHGHLTEPYARYLFRQLVHAVSFCHSQGVYHRDLKPDNIMLTDNNVLKILDFGLAKLRKMSQAENSEVSRTMLLHTQCGTPNYIAPEILTASKEGYSGSKVDAWSIGIILYVMIAGSLPFESSESENLFKLILRCNVTYPEHFSPALKDLIGKILTNDPQQRLSIDAIKEHPWLNGPAHTSMDPSTIPISNLPSSSSNEHPEVQSNLYDDETSFVSNLLSTPLKTDETFQSLNLGENTESFSASRAQIMFQNMIAESDAMHQDTGFRDDHSDNTSSSPGLLHEDSEADVQIRGEGNMIEQPSPQYHPPQTLCYNFSNNELTPQSHRADAVVVAEAPATRRVCRGTQVNSLGNGMNHNRSKFTLSMKHGLRNSGSQTPPQPGMGLWEPTEDRSRHPRPAGSRHSQSAPLVLGHARRKPRTPDLVHEVTPSQEEYFPVEHEEFKRPRSGCMNRGRSTIHPARRQGENQIQQRSSSEPYQKKHTSVTILKKCRTSEQNYPESTEHITGAYAEGVHHTAIVASRSASSQWNERTPGKVARDQCVCDDSPNKHSDLLLEDSWLDTKCHPKAWGMWLTPEIEHGKSRDMLNDGWGSALAEEGLLRHPSRGTSETRVRFSEDETPDDRRNASPKRQENSVHIIEGPRRTDFKHATDKNKSDIDVLPDGEEERTPDRTIQGTSTNALSGTQLVPFKGTESVSEQDLERKKGLRPRPNTFNALEMEIPGAQSENTSSPRPGIGAALRPGLDGAWRFLKSPGSVIGKAPSTTQFYTFEKPLKCYQTVVKALGEYSCVKITPSTGLPVSRFRVKFEVNRFEDSLAGTIVVAPHDRNLAKVIMKKRIGVEEEVFTQFFSEFYGKCGKISKSLAGLSL